MRLSIKGVAFIKGYEQCRLVAYKDSHVPPIWTIGWGHTGPDVQEGTQWTQEHADNVFVEEDSVYAEHAVATLVTASLSQNQFDALVSLVYNIGATAFQNSTLLRLLNVSDYAGASAQILVWDHSGGVVSLGLRRRRLAEQQVFDALPLKVSAPPPVVVQPTSVNFIQAVLNFLSSLFKKGS